MTSILAAILVATMAQFGQANTGELRLTVVDPSGLALPGAVELVSESNQVSEHLKTDDQGSLTVKRLPFGTYRVSVTRDGFTPFAGVVAIKSALPTPYRVTMSVAALQSQVTVAAGETLLDPHQAVTVNRVGAETLAQRRTALPGRSLPDLVNAQPGWLVEANGILHPRGSEYQTQFVVDGLPMTDNRSPAFAPEIGAEDVRGMSILTGGYPAEYGRKLGGVIEVVTAGQDRPGFHGSAAVAAGSFASRSLDLSGAYSRKQTTISLTAGLAATDRYLDPPVEENFTNHGSMSHVAARLEHDLSLGDRFGVIVRRGDADFLVPNERVQQEAGQRQERSSGETAAQFSYQHIFSGRVVADFRGMARDLTADLRSNAASTPILASQDRGFRELYLKGTVAGHAGAHEWKAGGDLDAASIREAFAYQITDPGEFDDDTAAAFTFEGSRPAREQALFVQDQWRQGAWTVNAGLRWDHYRLVVSDHALSPRLGVAWSWPTAEFVARVSYDRAFQTPAVENLLLASDAEVDELGDDAVRLPVRPSRGHFFDAGFSKAVSRRARVDVGVFRRAMDNFADDDVLLNTGVSFPIAFESAEIHGAEIKLEVPRWGRTSGFLSYSHMRGTGTLPIAGGLFLGDEVDELLEAGHQFRLSQDQAHTIRGRISHQLTPSFWAALAASYDSGLPVEEFDGDRDDAVGQYGEEIVAKVNFETGRVRPSFSLDASVGLALFKSGDRRLGLQVDARNLANRLNVINFSGLFSGTALAPPRSIAIRLHAQF
jgi:TonB dependent receptor-like, beta-barrel/Carboxypeptidase regulatory-like domain